MNNQTPYNLKTKTKIFYSITETGLLMISFMFASQLLFFMTDFLSISAAAAGTMFLITRIWDAVNDPMMGVIADKNNSRFGKYRPFILIGGIPLVISLVLSFTDMGFSNVGNLIYMYIIYTLFGMAYTATFIPYTTLIGNLTTTPAERSSLSAMKGAFQALGVLLASIFTVPLIIKFGGAGEMNAKGFQTVAVLYAVIALVIFCITFFNVKERNIYTAENTYKINWKTFVNVILLNKNLVLVSIMYFLIYLRMFLNNSTVNYFFLYELKKPFLIPLFMSILAGVNIISAMFVPRLATKLGKKKFTMAGMFVCFLAYVGLYFARGAALPVFFTLTTIVALSGSIPYLLIWGLVADVADETEKNKGYRADGLLYSTVSFMNKMGAALAGAISGFVLTAYGYVPKAEQTARALAGIDILMFIIPAVCMGLVVVVMAFYKLD
ncbi:MFS transporter [Lutispora sp.]|uniref:MFS transporter n=1 Tax=Lutispora sp. TaxID=2828727 RepID=UPI002B1F0B27|nr:glycoside-pentoside-hexuronide (GPH):cation symporter [Lutispora sp.]MEA4960568.1 glycoside-pentoside-hexuronide (GPH):cation symporter [Lutispora sp.]